MVRLQLYYLQVLSMFLFILATSMFESMWSSMTSSMQLAQECMRQDEANPTNDNAGQQLEGIEKFAQLIDSGELFVNEL